MTVSTGGSATLGTYILRRLAQAIPLILGVIAVNFILIRVAPGDPITYLIGDVDVDPTVVQRLRADLGLDQPMLVQLWIYLQQVLRLNLGYSYHSHLPVLSLILERLPATFLLMAAALVIASSLGVLLGVLSATRPYSVLDNVITTVSLFGYSTPSFWAGQLLLIAFALLLGWLPAGGMVSPRFQYQGFQLALDVGSHLILPAFSLGLILLAQILRLTRASMLEVLEQDFITTARAKGLSESRVVVRHALRNSLLPVVTIIGVDISTLVAGAVLVEVVYSWPGLGRLMFSSLLTRDYPTMMGLFIFFSVSTILVTLVVDITYAFLDPRIRY